MVPFRAVKESSAEGEVGLKPTTSGTLFGLSRRTALLLVSIIVVFAIAATAFTFTYGKHFSKPGGDGKAYERAAIQLLQRASTDTSRRRPTPI